MSSSHAMRYQPFLTMLFAILLSLFPHCLASAADNLVTGKYVSSSGTDIVLNLTIQNPAPANLIVEQYLSPENKIIDTTPQAKKIDVAQGNIKWLFKNTRNGILSLSLRLDNPLIGDISAIVRYRAPQGGAFTELRIAP